MPAPRNNAFWSPEDDEDAGGADAGVASFVKPPGASSSDSSAVDRAAELQATLDPEEMLGQVRALRERLDETRARLARARQANATLVRDNERLETEVDELISQRAQLVRVKRGAATAPVSGLVDNLDLVDIEEDFDIVADAADQLRERGWFGYASELVRRTRRALRSLEARFVRRLPIVRDVARLSTRYGASMAVYFSFCAWLTLNAVFQLLIFGPLLASQVRAVVTGSVQPGPEESQINVFNTFFVYYSSFSPSDGALYTGVLSASVVTCVISTARKYVAERRQAQWIEVYGLGSDRMRFARAVLNGWDMGVDGQQALGEAQSAFADRLRLLVDEEQRADRIDRRGAAERAALRFRRLVGISVSVAYLVLAWAIIIALQLNGRAISQWLSSSVTGGALLADFAVPVAVSAVNVALPVLTMWVTHFERWDYPATTLRLQVFRLYLGKILNLLINVAGYGILVARQKATPQGVLYVPVPGSASFSVQLVEPDASRWGCAENQVGTTLLLFVAVEFVVDKLVSAGKALFFRFVWPVFTRRPWQREPFPIAQKVINLIYFQALLWLCMPYFPFITVVAPVMLYATFKFDAELLRVAMAKPANPWSADDIGAFFFRIYFITFGVALAWNYLFLRGEDVHACGPHGADASAWVALERWISSATPAAALYNVLLNALVLWVLLAIAYVRGTTNDSHKETLQDYAESRISQLAQQAALLDARVRVQERQLNALRKQLKGGKSR